MTLTEMKQERTALLAENDRILNTADNERRDVTTKEEAAIRQNFDRIDELNDLIEVKKDEIIAQSQDGEGWTPIQQFGSVANSAPTPTQKGIQITT